MANFVALGFLEVSEKFPCGGVYGLISIPTTELHQPDAGLSFGYVGR